MDVNGVVESVMQLMKKYSIRSPSFKMEPNLRFITQYVLLLKCRLVFIVLCVLDEFHSCLLAR